MRLSRTTLVAPIPGRAEALLVQPLTGQVAVVAAEDGRALERLGEGGALPATLPEADLREAGFVVDGDADDRALHARAWTDYATEVAATPTQLVFVPTFACNLRCTDGNMIENERSPANVWCCRPGTSRQCQKTINK